VALTWPVILAVLCGAALHASWNALVKSAGDKTVDTALVHFLGACVAHAVAVVGGAAAARRGTLHRRHRWSSTSAYYIALAGAYQHGELGMTYPIMRGFAPLLVALGSGTLIGEAPSTAAWLGIVAITVGVALVGLAHPGEALHHRKALAFAFTNAAIIAVYTVVDGLGVRAEVAAGGSAWRYVLWLFVLDGMPYPLLVWLRRTPQQRREIVAYARQRWPKAALGRHRQHRQLCDCAVGDDARAGGQRGRAARNQRALRSPAGHLAAEGEVRLQRALGTLVVVLGVMALRLG
jgi:drug/metabolite transporter (DMT)-like permease